MVYRVGKQCVLDSGSYDWRIVKDQADLDSASAEGWRLDQYAAKESHEKQEVQGQEAAQEVLTERQKLEAQAEALGVKVDKRWGDAKLKAAIEAAQ